MNLQLPSEHQRLFVLIGVGVIALAGLFLVTRGGGGESTGTSSPPAKTSPAKPGTAKGEQPKGDSGKSSSTGSQSAAKPSKQAYVNCVEQATDTAALEKCQALVP
jgi:hypothetical protein